MRPTIPLADWRLAIDLAAARTLQHRMPAPVCGRTCEWCRNWARAYPTALSSVILGQLRRIGIDPAYPVDLYGSADAPDGEPSPQRIIFHTVGRILSGPGTWWRDVREDPRRGRARNYEPLKCSDGTLVAPGLSVGYAGEVFDGQSWHAGLKGPVLQIDFRLPVRWHWTEPRPTIYPMFPEARRAGAV
jgi:hypothetical protein